MANRLVLFGAGFLLCVLWIDLKFDSLVWGVEGDLPEEVLAAIAAYYNRVVPSDLQRVPLIAVVMLITLGATLRQAARSDLSIGFRFGIPLLAWPPIVLAMLWIVPSAAELGERSGSISEQSSLARGIFWAHAYCFVSIALLTVAGLWVARIESRRKP